MFFTFFCVLSKKVNKNPFFKEYVSFENAILELLCVKMYIPIALI